MPDIPQGWATIDAAVIAVVGGGLMAMLGFVLRRLKRVKQDTETTVYHVANEHKDERGDPINLRDDNDEKHSETMDTLKQIQRVQVDQARDIGGIRQELRTLHENDAEHVRQQNRDRERLDRFEHTLPGAAVRRIVAETDEEPDE
ncbi:hypothetical protein [Humibacter sp. RRB41]|uniref:hypothetical protein n=1 Tax=Humibacter sp. RRB41 TaxID=2919946 RepID=UPI001FAA75C3|nr:hypothetical protein [Humibacter sp. RRB41]